MTQGEGGARQDSEPCADTVGLAPDVVSSGGMIPRAAAPRRPPGLTAPPALTSPIVDLLHEVYEKYRAMRDGELATYIPELAKVGPDLFGIAIVTLDGHVYEVGDARSDFTMQSIAKPLIYGLALQDHGRDAVLKRIGVEPSGDPFNAIVFDERNNRPFNPMVNAGAIAATALLRGDTAAVRMARILELFRGFCGHEVVIDEAVYRSEAATGHRNRAIAYLELNNGMIDGDADEHVDLYFRQCAIRTSAADLAFIGATLANGGVNPASGEQVLASGHVRDVMSVMTTCGMYDYAGEWELRVGLPAKSGVSGGIMAVLPGQLGLGVFSPRLDDRGNSLRGIRVCEELSSRLKLHLLDHRGGARSAVRRIYRGADRRSKRVRNAADEAVLDAAGTAVRVVELHGNLFFGNTERVIRHILEDEEARYLIVDVGRVAAVDEIAAGLLRALASRFASAGRTVLFADAPAELQARLGLAPGDVSLDLDTALEHCEDALLRRVAPAASTRVGLARLRDFALLEELDEDELRILDDHLAHRSYAAGETIIDEGTASDSLFLLLGGSVDVRVTASGAGGSIRVASIDAGNVFGELALLGTSPRTANVIAAMPVTVLQLKASRIAALAIRHPTIQAKVVAAVGRSLAERLRRANAVIRTLTR